MCPESKGQTCGVGTRVLVFGAIVLLVGRGLLHRRRGVALLRCQEQGLKASLHRVHTAVARPHMHMGGLAGQACHWS